VSYGTQRDMVPLPNKPSLATIQAFERELRKFPAQVHVEMPPKHHFADGLYGREILIPAGTVLTGKIHKGEHLNFLMQGDITVWTEEGMKRIQAPAVIVSKPGTKRVGLAHTDTIWVTVHATHETNLDRLEAELIEPETDLIEGEAKCLGSP
jgi:hypothetical protein